MFSVVPAYENPETTAIAEVSHSHHSLLIIINPERRYGELIRSLVMHDLSFGTWWIHWASVFEWLAAIVLIQRRGTGPHFFGISLFGLSMVPALISAMAACTWHIYDNAESLRWLVTLQASTTLLGNYCLALVAAHKGVATPSVSPAMKDQ